MGRNKIRTGGTLTTVYFQDVLLTAMKKAAKAKGISLNTLVTQELAALYLER